MDDSIEFCVTEFIVPPCTSRCSTRHAQSSLDRFDKTRIYLYARIELAQFIVKISASEHGMTKDTSCHGHRDRTGLVFREKTIRHHGSNLGEFPTRVRQNLQGKDVLAGGNDRKECSKVRRRNGVRRLGQI